MAELSGEEVACLKKIAYAAIDQNVDALTHISQAIWQKPELAYDEHHAHGLLADFLASRDFQVEKKFHLDTAFRATAGTNAKPNIGIMCEYDALPGIGHACGHNLIAVLGAATGLGIKAALQSSEKPIGQVTVLGTPAEENGGGKCNLITAGAFKDIDVALMAHPAKYTAPKMRVLANTDLVVTYTGKASHAAAAPWNGVNALDAAVLAYNNLSAMRQQMKSEWLIHGIIREGGLRPNIIPEKTVLEYYLRTAKYSDLAILKDKVIACFDGAARATGCQVEYHLSENPYRDMVYNETLLSLYNDAATHMNVASDKPQLYATFIGGSTDMGNVSHVVPSIHPFFSVSDSATIHTREFQTAAGTERAFANTMIQAKVLASVAIDVYCSPAKLQQVRSEFEHSPHMADHSKAAL